MKIMDVVRAIEAIAPPHLAEDWDNVGLLVGDAQAKTKTLILCIDLTEAVLAEAVAAGAGMVMAYHPAIFKPISRVTAEAAPIVYAAARRGIAVYSCHTALDAAPGGIDDILADALGVTVRRPIKPSQQTRQHKVVVFVPPDDLSRVSEAAFEAGAGALGNYSHCAFFSHGIGTFRAENGAHPTVGRIGQQHATEEVRLEFIADSSRLADVCQAIRHAHHYEEPAIDIFPMVTYPEGCGMGRIGRLARPVTIQVLVSRIKKALGVRTVNLAARPAPDSHGKSRSGGGRGALVTRVACAAGAGGSLFRLAAASGATFYLTGEMAHHDVLAAVHLGMTVLCAGHSHTERVALKHLQEKLRLTAPALKVALAQRDSDPFEVV